MIGVLTYRFGKAPRCVSQLEAHVSPSARWSVVVNYFMPRASHEVSRSLCDGGAGGLVRYRLHTGLPNTAARSTAGDDATLARRITD
jgi:hypothetical protein